MMEKKFATVVQFIGDQLFEAHRGVIHLSCGDFVVFGNDGFATDERAKREVAVVRERTAGRASEIAFATTEDGYSWALLLRLPEEHATEAGREAFCELLTLAMWEGYSGGTANPLAGGFEQCQSRIAEAVIWRERPRLMGLLSEGMGGG